MKYYIIKPKSASVSKRLMEQIKYSTIVDVEFVNNLEDCDVAVLQHGWDRSKYANNERLKAINMNKKILTEVYTVINWDGEKE